MAFIFTPKIYWRNKLYQAFINSTYDVIQGHWNLVVFIIKFVQSYWTYGENWQGRIVLAYNSIAIKLYEILIQWIWKNAFDLPMSDPSHPKILYNWPFLCIRPSFFSRWTTRGREIVCCFTTICCFGITSFKTRNGQNPWGMMKIQF